jgi:hypothetical protein
LEFNASQSTPKAVLQYLNAIQHAANAVAELTGPPLAERRLLMELPARAEAIGQPEFANGIFGLLGGNESTASALSEWLPAWENAFVIAAETPHADLRVHSARQAYYKRAIESMLTGENPQEALYPLLYTWTLAISLLPEAQSVAWQDAIARLKIGGEDFSSRLTNLDHYLDSIEEMLEKRVLSFGFEMTEIV